MMDNVSICSGQTASTTGMYANRSVPRSNSTTDLFDTALPGSRIGVPRKRKSGPGLQHSFSSSSLDLGTMPRSVGPLGPRPPMNSRPVNLGPVGARSARPVGTRPVNSRPVGARPAGPRPVGPRPLGPIPEARRAKLTPYQQQRKQMRNSFQFPNGESFTPRNRYLSKSSSTLSLSTRTQSMGSRVPRTLGPMPGPMSGPPMSGPPMSGPMSGPMPRSQSLTSLSTLQGQVRGPSPAPLIHFSASPVNSTGSTISSTSGSSVGSRATTVTTPERNIKAPFAPAFAPEPEPYIKGPDPEPHPMLRGSEPKSASEPELEPELVLASRESEPATLEEIPDQAEEPKELYLVPQPPEPQTETPEPKKSKIGMLFRKLFRNSSTGNMLRKRKRNQRDNSATPSGSSSPVLAPPSKTRHCVSVTAEGSPLSSVKGIGLAKDLSGLESPTRTHAEASNDLQRDRKASLTPSLETEDDVLMDTDLVFDSLLLKANSNSASSWQKQQDLQLKLQALGSPENLQHESESSLHKQVSEDDDPNVDYELVKEFSKLGNYIEVPNATPTGKSFPILPRRSPKRPALTSKNLAKSFYDQDFTNCSLMKRLEGNWETIHFDCSPPVATNEVVREKSLRFATDVYVKDTWAPADYNRSDKKFIKDRRRMIQLESNGFVNAIKLELNEYKRNEMIVHCDSTKFTHFFV